MEANVKILLIEDDPSIGRMLTVSLEAEHLKVNWLQDLKSALASDYEQYRLIILDLNLPDGNGLSFLRKIKSENSNIPVIVLTAKTDEDSVVEGILAGAKDYMKKPFSHKELLARISVTLREVQKLDPQLKYGNLQVFLDKRKIFYKDQEIELNRREFDILNYLIGHAEAVVTRDTLLNLFDKEGDKIDRAVDSHISHLRTRLRKAKIREIKINPIYGIGYRLEIEE